MKLYFVRHGQAEDRADWAHHEDHLRPLTKDGIKRMRQSAATMRDIGLKPGAIITSPLVRARQTADILADVMDCELVEEECVGLNFGVAALSELMQAFSSYNSLLFVGHEPDFSNLVQTLIGGGRVIVKKGSLIRVDLFSTTPPRGELVWNIPPKLLAR